MNMCETHLIHRLSVVIIKFDRYVLSQSNQQFPVLILQPCLKGKEINIIKQSFIMSWRYVIIVLVCVLHPAHAHGSLIIHVVVGDILHSSMI